MAIICVVVRAYEKLLVADSPAAFEFPSILVLVNYGRVIGPIALSVYRFHLFQNVTLGPPSNGGILLPLAWAGLTGAGALTTSGVAPQVH